MGNKDRVSSKIKLLLPFFKIIGSDKKLMVEK